MAPNDDRHPDAGERSGVSRRAFLKTVGVSGVAASVVDGLAEALPHAQGAGGPPPIGPGAVPITLKVNGRAISLRVEPRTTLLDALRNQAGQTGNKRVCDRGTCGACTMIIDGRTHYACSTLAIEAQGREIRSIEGLAQGTVLHPVQQAFAEADGSMCGFCTPGFVMSAVALLERNPHPTPEEARKALDGNICRCGTYVKVLEATLKVKGVSRG
ncbi:MAG TPA: (2Fe-2S)-binding protein [Vicinamibacterales bacterium]|nr:(2Fe-2S)-binding protein [Vicinamibacterales bacterium]